MGLRFKKIITLAPGARINIGRKSSDLSQEAPVNPSSRGMYGTSGIPGTDIAYRTRLDSDTQTQSSTIKDLYTDEFYLSAKDTGVIQAVTEKGKTLPPRYVKRIKEQDPEAFSQFLRQECDRINDLTKSLSEFKLHIPAPDYQSSFVPASFDEAPPVKTAPSTILPSHPIPPKHLETGLINWLYSLFGQSDAIRFQREQADYEQACKRLNQAKNAYQEEALLIKQNHEIAFAEWEKRKKAFEQKLKAEAHHYEEKLRNDTGLMFDRLSENLEKITWQEEMPVSFDIDQNKTTLVIDVGLPEIENFPFREAEISGDRLRIKRYSALAARQHYAEYISAIALMVCGTTFNQLPAINRIVVSGFTQQKQLLKTVGNDEYLYSCSMTRRAFAQIDFENLTMLNPLEALALGNLRCNISKTFLFKPVTPITLETTTQAELA